MTIDISWLSDTLGYHYVDLAGARIREKLSGEDSVNFVLDSGADQFVAKWYSNVDMRMLGEELAAMRWLATRGVSVPAVVVTRDGTDFAEVAGGCLVLLHFIAGDVLGDDFSCALQIAAFLADFHQQSTAFTGPFCSDRSEFARLAAFKSSCADDGAIVHVDGIQRFISDYENEVALFRATQHDVHGNAECGIIHHDLHSGNFLVDAEDGAITAMLDFSEGHYGMLVFDLAILLGSWAWNREGEGLDIDRCRQLLTTYQQRRPICAMDRALLPHALLLYFATDATGYLLPKLRESTLESLSQCNMYTGFYTLRENRSWMGELASLMDPASVGLS